MSASALTAAAATAASSTAIASASAMQANKYDRQLRLWGPTAQARLSASRVCLLNATAAGCEVLKNLILPGVGHVTVVDGGVVTAGDVSANWFTRGPVGAPRAGASLAALLELNPDVSGASVAEEPMALLARDPTFFAPFDLVICTGLRWDQAVAVADGLGPGGRLLVVRAVGLFGSVRVFVREHTVVESKPDNATLDDLRIPTPFPSLAEFARGVHLDSVDDMVHSHVPWVVLLLRAADAWKSSHGGALPSSLADKGEFKTTVKAMNRPPGGVLELNVKEALEHAYMAYGSGSLDPGLASLLGDAAAVPPGLSAASPPFWFCAAALRDFFGAHGALPVSPTLPDMTSTTNLFLGLQAVYAAQADADEAELAGRVDALVASVGGAPVPREVVRTAARNARKLRLLRYRSLREEEAGRPGDDLVEELVTAEAGAGGDADTAALSAEVALQAHPLLWYWAVRAGDAVAASRGGRAPGVCTGDDVDDLAAACAAVGVDFDRGVDGATPARMLGKALEARTAAVG